MSCEGYYQCFCKNRHYDTIGNLDERLIFEGLKITDLCCEECGEPFIWSNFVDDTNCDEVGKIDVKFDEDGLVPLHKVSNLLQIQQQNNTGFYHTCGEWRYSRGFERSYFSIGANGTPVIAIVPLEHVSIHGQKANAKSICAVPKMIKIINKLAECHDRLTYHSTYNEKRCVEDLKEAMEQAEEIIKNLKNLQDD